MQPWAPPWKLPNSHHTQLVHFHDHTEQSSVAIEKTKPSGTTRRFGLTLQGPRIEARSSGDHWHRRRQQLAVLSQSQHEARRGPAASSDGAAALKPSGRWLGAPHQRRHPQAQPLSGKQAGRRESTEEEGSHQRQTRDPKLTTSDPDMGGEELWRKALPPPS
jgi:hypothetical protein